LDITRTAVQAAFATDALKRSLLDQIPGAEVPPTH
jgi:hypothetical protein